ncbi:MAG: hypothetical protein AOA65_2021 [Candidatus Bathyarchaeota archaeon BA1]|nr:MAG: hypothetical protein AOA65_2021 [Candidatus Bathyarchaeota archaeon BA1]
MDHVERFASAKTSPSIMEKKAPFHKKGFYVRKKREVGE